MDKTEKYEEGQEKVVTSNKTWRQTIILLTRIRGTYNRHVQKTPFVLNLLGWLTFISILVLRTIFDLNFFIKIRFQCCPEPFYYTMENAKNTKKN